VGLAGERGVDVGEEVLGDAPAGGVEGVVPGCGAVGRELRDEGAQPADGELAAVVGREVDAVEALEVGFDGIGGLAEDRDER